MAAPCNHARSPPVGAGLVVASAAVARGRAPLARACLSTTQLAAAVTPGHAPRAALGSMTAFRGPASGRSVALCWFKREREREI